MTTRFMTILCLLRLFLVLAHLPTAYTSTTGPYGNLGDLFQHHLQGLQRNPPGLKNPYAGGRNPLQCCNLAINESLEIRDGDLFFKPGQTCLKGDPRDFLRYQYPCTAQYNGTASDQPQVWVSYSWCRNNCPGWTRTKSSPNAVRNWVKPFISFIMPAIIFCLNVARRRRITVPSRLFPRKLISFNVIFTLIIKIPVASILVSLDILFWLITILCVAGPCLISGVYEAVLDLRLIKFVEGRMSKNGLTVQQRAHLLLVILLGNFDRDPTWNDMLQMVDRLPGDSLRQQPRASDATTTKERLRSNESLMAKDTISTTLGSVGVAESAFQWPTISRKGTQSTVPSSYQRAVQARVNMTKTRLKTILEAQIGFGSAVGAAVVFYSNTSHNLVFGMFWMIVPHVAVVSSLLLSGTNPNTWEAICTSVDQTLASQPDLTSRETSLGKENVGEPSESQNVTKRRMSKFLKGIRGLVFRPVYDSAYKPAWPWHWGTSKAIYVSQLVYRYPKLMALEEEVLQISLLEWIFSVSFPALFLLLVPSFLGGMVSYTTPSVGLSCRSMTMLMYAVSQTWLILLWICDWMFWRRDHQGRLITEFKPEHQRPIANIIWYFAFFLGVGLAFFTAVFGSIFQLMGLYANCLCFVPLRYWRVRNTSPDAILYLGGGSTEQVYYASTYWIPCGVAATVFLIATTYIGWWYQRHLRHRFRKLVDNMDHIDSKDLLENGDQDQGGHKPMISIGDESLVSPLMANPQQDGDPTKGILQQS